MKKIMIFAILALAAVMISACDTQQAPAPLACTEEAKLCPDGSSVARNSSNNCEFDPCPEAPVEGSETVCATDVMECYDGSTVSRNPDDDCKFDACPEVIICKEDLKTCPDGKKVARDPKLNCDFPACAVKNTSTSTSTSSSSSSSSNTSSSGSNSGTVVEDDDSEVKSCRSDTKLCEDGSIVGRDPEDNCNFKPCPSGDSGSDYLPPSSYASSPIFEDRHYCTTQQKSIDSCAPNYNELSCAYTDEEAQIGEFASPCEACQHAQTQYWVEGACEPQ